jgi:hypothetical protein
MSIYLNIKTIGLRGSLDRDAALQIAGKTQRWISLQIHLREHVIDDQYNLQFTFINPKISMIQSNIGAKSDFPKG